MSFQFIVLLLILVLIPVFILVGNADFISEKRKVIHCLQITRSVTYKRMVTYKLQSDLGSNANAFAFKCI